MRDLQELFERAKDYLDVIEVPYSKDIEWIKANSRYTRRYGNCAWHYDNKKGRRVFQIQIASFLLSEEITDDKVVLSTIIHELIHTCEGCQNHGAKFHYWGDLVTDCYGIEITTYVSDERAAKVREAGVAPKRKSVSYNWAFNCENCGREWKYKKMPKFMQWGFNPSTMTASGGKCPFCKKAVHILEYTNRIQNLPLVY